MLYEVAVTSIVTLIVIAPLVYGAWYDRRRDLSARG